MAAGQKTELQAKRLHLLVARLAALPAETEWVEFKENYFDPEDLGEYISALSNSAALSGQDKGYMIWGVSDSDHSLVGTTFSPQSKKQGNEDLTPWLFRSLRPQVHFEFHEFEADGKRFVVLEVNPTHTSPVRFKENEYIRVGSYKKKLRDFPEHERRLWNIFGQVSFEDNSAATGLDDQEVLDMIDYPSYFTLLKRRLPSSPQAILEGLAADSVVRRSTDTPSWEITNVGAMLFARNLTNFPSLERKALRIIQYKGKNRISKVREHTGIDGYATGFADSVRYLNELLQGDEEIGEALRDDTEIYPKLAVRELLANALVHQDFTQTGNGPMVEVFDGRIEVTSPGQPLIEPARFIDAPPKSRNEKLASLMRRAGICEERGSGWDKIGFEIELHQLPAPRVEVTGSNTRVHMFGPKPFQDMDKGERLRAVYLHACLRYVEDEALTNATLRVRFGVKSSEVVSRLIKDAVEEGLISPFDPNAGKRYMKYLPSWAMDSVISL